MKANRRVAVITGNRAEFGLLEPVMRAIQKGVLQGSKQQVRLQLRTVVTGNHLLSSSWRDIEKAGFKIDAKVPMQRRAQAGRHADVVALGRGVSGFGKLFATMKPSVVLVLGDRIEPLAAACAAQVGGFHLAHIHGGDRAMGVADEAMRHAISKLAHIHFAATSNSRKRLIRMGELSDVVYQVGSPAADGLRLVEPAADAPQMIVVQHPIGAHDDDECRWMKQTLRATSRYDRLVLAPNGDPGSRGINRAIREGGLKAVQHVPRGMFLSQLAGANAIVGNSSSGLIEAAVLGCPSVNVGPRQAGRDKPATVVDCQYGTSSVTTALRKALSGKPRKRRHPYGDGHTGDRIADVLASIDLTRLPKQKHNAY